MWILTGNEKSPETTYRLLCNRDILVGRKGDIKLEDDKSISKSHASIRVTYTAQDMFSSIARGRVTLSDHSKYGTWVRGQRLQGDVQLSDGDPVRFGLQWNSWTLRWRPLTVVMSLLSLPEREQLTTVLVELGATLTPDWTASVNYLVMSKFKLSIKAAQALAAAVPLVTPAYLAALRDCLRARPASADPTVSDFLPQLNEPSLAGQQLGVAVDPRRTRLLAGKTFVFAEEAQLQRMRMTVELAGGTAVGLSECRLTDSQLTAPGVVVMHTEAKSPRINRLKAVLRRKKLRLVQDQELGLALWWVSCERDCNPAFDYAATFLPPLASSQTQAPSGAVLARETQAAEPAPRTPSSCRVVPPTPPTAVGAMQPPPARRSPRRTDVTASDAAVLHTAPTPQTAQHSGAAADPESSAGRHVVPPTPDTPATASGKSSRRSPSLEWGADAPESKRARLRASEPDGTETEVTPTATRPAETDAPQPTWKRPRLSTARRSRRDDADLFDFELESAPARRPAREQPPAPGPSRPQREPVRPVTPPPPPAAPPAAAAVQEEPGGEWRTSLGSAAHRAATAPPDVKPDPDQTTVSANEMDRLSASCMRLEVTDLMYRRPAAAPAIAHAADTPNFKRFKRARAAPICPVIIGGSDLFVSSRQDRGPFTTSRGGAGDPDGSASPPQRREMDDEDIMRMLDGVGSSRRSRRR